MTELLRIPKIRALDLRSLDVKVAEHNARPGALQLAIWRRSVFRQSVRQPLYFVAYGDKMEADARQHFAGTGIAVIPSKPLPRD